MESGQPLAIVCNVISKTFRSVVLFALASATAPAIACETQPDISQLPGETPNEAALRFQKTFADQSIIDAYEREKYGLDHALLIYVAKVIKADVGHFSVPLDVWPSATVQPLAAIKGVLPKMSRHLVITALTSCGLRGDGDAANAALGTIVVVFEGLPKSEWRPNGLDSIRATDARTFELLDPIYPFGKPIPNPWDK